MGSLYTTEAASLEHLACRKALCSQGQFSMGLLQGSSPGPWRHGGLWARQMLHLPAAQLRSSDNKLSHNADGLPIWGAEQPHSQRCLVQAIEGQSKKDKLEH